MVHKRSGLKRNRNIAPIAGSHACEVLDGCENCDPESIEFVRSLNFDQVSIAGPSPSTMEKATEQLKSLEGKNKNRLTVNKKIQSSIRKRPVSLHNDETNILDDSDSLSKSVKKYNTKKEPKKPRRGEMKSVSAGETEYKEDCLKVPHDSILPSEKVAMNAMDCKSEINVLITIDSKTTVSEVVSTKVSCFMITKTDEIDGRLRSMDFIRQCVKCGKYSANTELPTCKIGKG